MPHSLKLTLVQRRVLGVLMEKALTTPGGYPMTLNSLVTGCNQLTCREPITQLTEGEVGRALHELQTWREGPLVRQAEGDRTARASRYEHLVEQRFAWDKRQRAVMAELLLRGPQTAGELKTNASRMAPFEDLQLVLNLLTELSQGESPYVVELPRQPGRNTVRYDHLLYAEPSAPESPIVAPAPIRAEIPSDVLSSRVTRLETDLADLRRQFEALKAELGSPPAST